MRNLWAYLWGHGAAPLGPVPAGAWPGLGALALLLRLYAAGLIGFLAGSTRLADVPVLGVVGFIPYGYDKLLGGNAVYGMGPEFFPALGLPLPEVTAVLVGVLELCGGVALIFGLLTRPIAFLLAGSMAVALATANNWPEELPLLVACLLLVWLGGGLLSLDRLLDRRLARRPEGRPVPVPAAAGSRGPSV